MNASELEFQEIYNDFQSKILRYMSRMVGDIDAEDLTQEVFVKAHRTLKDFKGESKLSTWLYRIATNTALDKLRSPSFQQTKQTCAFDESDDAKNSSEVNSEMQKPSIERELIRDEANECLRDYIARLPEDYRVVLVLSAWEGLQNKEIAEIIGVTLDMVKIRLHRAKEKLRQDLIAHCDPHWIEESEFLPDMKMYLDNEED